MKQSADDVEQPTLEAVESVSDMAGPHDSDVVSQSRKFVELLRHEEFGVNVELSEDGRRLMNKQQERLGRSLERLSSDLYSKDTHFVLELIQNADDNDYHASMFELVLLLSLTFNFGPLYLDIWQQIRNFNS